MLPQGTLTGFQRRGGAVWWFTVLFVLLSIATSSPIVWCKQKPQLSTAERLEAEQRLSALGYWTGPIDGVLDPASIHALIAFQKVENRPRSGKLTFAELGPLRSASKPQPRISSFPHFEVDLRRQVMFMIDANGTVSRILPICSGSDKRYLDQGKTSLAHTPRGSFKVIRKINGWRRSSLGLLYYPNYIHQGIAIHGSPSVPTIPASHGCIRIPMFAAKAVSELMPVGTDVIIYDS